MMKRRQLLQATAAWPLMHMSAGVWAQDKWGQGQGYPTGLQGGLNRDPIPTGGALHRQTHVAGVSHWFF
ncbi:MAG: hypothetical protein RLZZ239_1665 [Pseudomonadota bacterium]